MNEKRALYSVRECSEILGIPQRTIREWGYARRIKTVNLGRRVMIPADTLNQIINEGVAA